MQCASKLGRVGILSLLVWPAITFAVFRQSPTSSPQTVAESQIPAAEKSLLDLIKDAETHFSMQEYAAATTIYQNILERARKEQSLLFEARALRGLAECAYRRSDLKAAQELFGQAIPMFESLGERDDLGRSFHTLAATFEVQGDQRKAQELYQKAFEIFESTGNLRGKAAVLLDKKQNTEEALAIATQIGDKALQAHALRLIGSNYWQRGEYFEAGKSFEQAIQILRDLGHPPQLPAALTELGRNYRAQGHPEAAIPLYEEAYRLQEQMQDRVGMVQSLNAIGVAYSFLDDFQKSKEYYEKALSLAEQTGSPRVVDFIRGSLAGNALTLGEYAKAAEILEAILARGLDSNKLYRYLQLATAKAGLRRFEEALSAVDKSLEISRSEGEQSAVINALFVRARIRRQLNQPDVALADLLEGIERIERQRKNLTPTDYFKRGFASQYQDIFSEAIALHTTLGQTSRGMELAEQGKARAFADLIATRGLDFKAKTPSNMFDPEREKTVSSNANADAGASGGALTLRGAETSSALHTALNDLRSKVRVTPSNAADLASSASRLHTTILSYWVGEEELFIWVASADGVVRGARVSLSKVKLNSLILEASRFSVAHPEGTSEEQRANAQSLTRRIAGISTEAEKSNAWRSLYDVLIRPVRGALPSARGARLTIIPHGPLGGLSFAALRNERGRYLLEDYSLNYVPSGTVLRLTELNTHADARSGDFLLVADPSPAISTGKEPLPELPGAHEEVQTIAGLVGHQRALVLSGIQATEMRVREGSPRKAVLHFATHAIARDDDPFNSYLALGSSSDSQTDGLLTAQEIYGLSLNADLVVLSACRSGGARIPGDGIAALARAFFYAGTQTLIVSLWDVADQPTNQLLPAFYRVWLRGENKSEALRKAQLQLLRNLRGGKVTMKTPSGGITLSEDPIFWAGFILLGEP
jgi:CHAT domain-containing protein/tetratricopeptide (TPR) repeat protein